MCEMAMGPFFDGIWSLRVIGGHPTIHNQFVQMTADAAVIITPNRQNSSLDHPITTSGSDGYQNPLSALSEPGVFEFRDGSGEVVISGSASSASSYLALEGPAGKGEYQLVRLQRPEDLDRGFGSSTEYTSWDVKAEPDSTQPPRLRYDQVSEYGHWIAVPADGEVEGDGSAWQIWWYEPCAANIEDFPTYYMVDLEVVVGGDWLMGN